jgi:hypothetical protein
MENDDYQKQIFIFEKGNSEINNVFKIDYQSQNLVNNKEYQNWKESMLKKYGNYSKQFKCLDDNILFYNAYNVCRSYPSFRGECPLCKKQICLFCSNSIPTDDDDIVCCLKRRLYKSLFYDGLIYIKKINVDDVDKKHILQDNLFIVYFIPILNFAFFVMRIFDFLYIKMATENSKKNNSLKLISNFAHLKIKISIYFLIICYLISFFLAISYFVFSIYFMLLIFIISLPFKFNPFKFYSGIFFEDNFSII